MNTPSLAFPRYGDKANSPWFEDILPRLLEKRDASGLTESIRELDAIMLTVEPGHSLAYIRELCLMSPYHYLVSLDSEKHWSHVLRIDLQSPDILVREVKDPNTRGIFRSLNEVYPMGAKRPNARYMGEIFRVTDVKAVVEMQKSREIRFFSDEELVHLDVPRNAALTKPSPYTHNILGYWQRESGQLRVYRFGESCIHPLVQEAYTTAKQWQEELSIGDKLLPIDHLATRVYSQNREAAILEYLTLTSYYFWGAYDIADQNSSTNVTKSVHYPNEHQSPAKVFTAANYPYFVNHLYNLPSPTENFVRNYGPRLHHIAFSVRDGFSDGVANIDQVVRAIQTCGRDFLLDVIGSPEDGLKQIFSTASEHSSLIIEYVQRFGDFQGFFTKGNVAKLTEAAGFQERV